MNPSTNRRAAGALVGASMSAALFGYACTLVSDFEGERTKTYLDLNGVPTYCFGETAGARMGRTYTHEQCTDRLRSNLASRYSVLVHCAPGLASAPDGERIAFLSFSYNVGEAAFCRSRMPGLLREHRDLEACAELSRYVYSGGRVIHGLQLRRARERAICEGKSK